MPGYIFLKKYFSPTLSSVLCVLKTWFDVPAGAETSWVWDSWNSLPTVSGGVDYLGQAWLQGLVSLSLVIYGRLKLIFYKLFFYEPEVHKELKLSTWMSLTLSCTNDLDSNVWQQVNVPNFYAPKQVSRRNFTVKKLRKLGWRDGSAVKS